MIDKKSKIFLGIFSLLVLVSISVTFYRYLIKKNVVFFTDPESFNQSLLEE